MRYTAVTYNAATIPLRCLLNQTRGPSIAAGYERTGAAGLGEGSVAATAAAAAAATSQLLSAAVSVQAMTSPKGSKADLLSIPLCRTCSEPVLTNARTDQRSGSLKQTLTAAMRKPAVAALRLSQVLPPHNYISQHSQHAVCSGPAGAAAGAAGGGDGGGSDEPHSAAVPRSEHTLGTSSVVRVILQGTTGSDTAAGTAAGTITWRAAGAGAGQPAWTRLSVELTDDDDIVRLGSCSSSSSSYWASATAAAADSYSTLPGTAGWHTSLDVTHSSSSFDLDIGSSAGDNSNGHCSKAVLPVQLTPLQLPATRLQGACLGSTLHACDAPMCTTTAGHKRCHSCDMTTCPCQQLSILSSTVPYIVGSKSATMQATVGSAVAAVAAALQHAPSTHAECAMALSIVGNRLATAACSAVRDQDKRPCEASSTSHKVLDAVCIAHVDVSELQCATQPAPGTVAASGVELRVHTHQMLASLEAVSPVAAAAPRAVPTQPELGTSWDRGWAAQRLTGDMPTLANSPCCGTSCGTGGGSATGCALHANRTLREAGFNGLVPGAVGRDAGPAAAASGRVTTAAFSKQWPARRVRYGAASLACEPGRQHSTAQLSTSGAHGSTHKPVALPIMRNPKARTVSTAAEQVGTVHELQAAVAALVSEKAGNVIQLSVMGDIHPGQQKELDQAEQQQTEFKKRCQELELQLIKAHFDKEELQGLLGAQAASAQQQADAQAAKHKQQVGALQQQVQDLLQLLSQAGCVHPLQLNPVRDALPKPAPACDRDVWRQGGKAAAVGSQHSTAGRRPSALVLQSSGQHSMGPMTAARQRQDQHAKACTGLVGIGRKQHSCLAARAGAGAGAGSRFVHRPASGTPAGDLLPPVQTVAGAAAAAVRRTAHTTAAAKHGHATVFSAQRKKSSTAGGSTPEAWYTGGVSQGHLRTPANSSSGACRSNSSSSSTSSLSSYKSSHSCFSR